MHLIFEYANSIEDTRQRTYRYFPIKKPLTFLIETDNRIVETVGYVESNEPDIFSSMETAQISIICDDPYFYSSGEDGQKRVSFSGTEKLFEFIFSNESTTTGLLEFGEIHENATKIIEYEGDSDVGMLITIHISGTISGNISIVNNNTRESLSIITDKIESVMEGPLLIHDEIVINTVRGSKGAYLLRDGDYHNILNAIDKESDWIQLTKGQNLIAISVESGVENLEIQIENRELYEGV